jgi:NADH-quinone oxidoreductase subunit M
MLGPQGPRVTEFPEMYWNEKLVMGIIVVLILVMGVYPQPVLDLVEPVMKDILIYSK